jgi:hypothetical protein
LLRQLLFQSRRLAPGLMFASSMFSQKHSETASADYAEYRCACCVHEQVVCLCSACGCYLLQAWIRERCQLNVCCSVPRFGIVRFPATCTAFNQQWSLQYARWMRCVAHKWCGEQIFHVTGV